MAGASKQRAKATDEDCGAEVGGPTGAGTVLAQRLFDGGQENVRCGVEHRRIAFQVMAQPLWYGQHPLANRQLRDDMVGQMRGGLLHAAGGVTEENSRGTHLQE
jgi:hypothetical protein